MVVVMQEGATEDRIQRVINKLMEMGFDIHRSTGARHTVLGAVGAKVDFDTRDIELLEGVAEVLRISAPYKLASRHFRPEGSVIKLGRGVTVGGEQVVVMAGPCGVESAEQIEAIAEQVAKFGARVLRGGAFKPRSSPYSFQGLGPKGLEFMRRAADKHNLLVVSELMDQTQIPLLLEYVDVLQVGARNMQNYNLLKELGKVAKPILLKRGIAATIEELLLSAEYIMAGGNYNVILCERGIRTFESYTRNTLDVSRDSRRQEALALADHRGPLARDGAARQGSAHGTSRGGGGSRWAADRSPPQSRQGLERWRAITLPGAV